MAGRGDSRALKWAQKPWAQPQLCLGGTGPWAGLFTPVLQCLICKVRALPTPSASGVNTSSAFWQTLLSEMPDLMCKTNTEVV